MSEVTDMDCGRVETAVGNVLIIRWAPGTTAGDEYAMLAGIVGNFSPPPPGGLTLCTLRFSGVKDAEYGV